MAEHHDLPGAPRRRLVQKVRSHLWRFGIRPKGESWKAAWSWASAVAYSYVHIHWPLPHEIATQYLVLLIAEMREKRALGLPFRAAKALPEEVQHRLTATTPLSIEHRELHATETNEENRHDP